MGTIENLHYIEKLKRVLETISMIAAIKDPCEENEAMQDIYDIARAFSEADKDPHNDWKEKEEIIYNKIKNGEY